MARKIRFALAALALGTVALGATEASAFTIGLGGGFHGGGIHIGGFPVGFGPGCGCRRVAVFPVVRSCYVQRWVTVYGGIAARRVCY